MGRLATMVLVLSTIGCAESAGAAGEDSGTEPGGDLAVEAAVETAEPGDLPEGEATADVAEAAPEAGTEEASDLPTEGVVDPIVPTPAASCAKCFVLADDAWDGVAKVSVPTKTDFSQVVDTLTYAFRPWIRFRTPHPGVVKRLFFYQGGDAGTVTLHLSLGVPGGHSPCVDEAKGDDKYPAGPVHAVEVAGTAGWRAVDVATDGLHVGAYDEFFVMFDMTDGARVGLQAAMAVAPGDYTVQGGLIADAPGDALDCFASQSAFTDADGKTMSWLVRAEIEADEVRTTHDFADAGAAGPAFGGQAAFGDCDGDGDDDLLAGGVLWRNDGAGGFTDITQAAGLAGLGGETLWGDYDNDGKRDILAVGGVARLFRNTGDCTFVETTAASGIVIDASSQGVAWVDADNDGLLDFYAASYGTLADPEVAAHDFFFHNNGDGTFSDRSQELGILEGPARHGRGVAVVDYDGDGWPDIYVGNYRLDPNQFWHNLAGTAFVDVAKATGVQGTWHFPSSYGHTIGPSFGDLDGDGRIDLVVPNLAHPRFLAISDPTWIDLARADATFDAFHGADRGIPYDETHSDSVLFDVDNDGDLDLFLTSVYEGRRSQLYANDGHAQFQDVTYAAGILHLNGWGAAAADVDGDGRVDLVANRLFRNQVQNGNHWLEVRLQGGATPGAAGGAKRSNRDAVGAVVTVTVGGLTLVRQVEGGTGVGCQNSATLHFGLGADAKATQVDVRWPSGGVTTVKDVVGGQVLALTEP